MDKFEVKFLGTRGSVPVHGPQYYKYGGSTSCVLLRIGGECIVLDAGSGFVLIHEHLAKEECELSLLISHPHIDHIMGLGMAHIMFDERMKVSVYGKGRCGLGVEEQIGLLMREPLWPVQPKDFKASASYYEPSASFNIGDVAIKTMEGSHPGGCTIYRLEYKSKSLVYATDYEISDDNFEALSAFAKDCDLLICDGQYAPEEMLGRRGYGHSTWDQAGEMALKCGAKMLRVFHHDCSRADEKLTEAEAKLRKGVPNSGFAARGEVIVL